MIEDTAAKADIHSAILALDRLVDRTGDAFYARLLALRDAPTEFDGLQAAIARQDGGVGTLLLQILLVSLLAVGTLALVTRILGHRVGKGRRVLLTLAAAVAALVVGIGAARAIAGSELMLQTLRVSAIVSVAGGLLVAGVRSILLARRVERTGPRSRRIRALTRDISIATAWSTAGIATVSTLRLWNAGPALVDVIVTGFVAIPAFILFAGAICRNRRTLSSVIAGPRPRSRWHTQFARRWPVTLLWFLILTFLIAETAITLGIPLPGGAVLLTVVIVLLTPHLDALMSNRATEDFLAVDVSILKSALQQTVRFVIFFVMIATLAALWVSPIAAAFGFDMSFVAFRALEIALIATGSAFLWNIIGCVTQRALHPGRDAPQLDMTGASPRSRLSTLVPLLSGIGKATILAFAFLSILLSIGVNVWPLVTGFSVFGLAIGFGSQTLVKDVVSGLFFLIDDAFRFGEYIETSGAKGTVEKISVRSVTLRNSRGSLATVPYGQIGKIQNFSRDWVVEKLSFRVAFDTDVDDVRKIFKQIGLDIAADPELAEDLLENFKSQGIADVEDGTLIIRGSFKAKAGRQAMIRRSVLIAVHRAFKEHGILAVAKPLSNTPATAAA